MDGTLMLWRIKVREKLRDHGWLEDDLDRKADEMMEPLRRGAPVARARSEQVRRRLVARGWSEDEADWGVINLILRRIDRLGRLARQRRGG